MNRLTFLFFLTLLSNIVLSQNCYVQLADLSQFESSSHQTNLESTACTLKSTFPSEFQNDFKVFDFGFYNINEYTVGGFEEAWEKIILEVQIASPYYLLFGKTTNGVNANIWIDFKLPQGSDECFVREAFIETNLNQILNSDTNLDTYAQREINAMEALAILGCEICGNEIDDDGDGYVDCYDLDCIAINGAQQDDAAKSNDPGVCYNLTESCVSSIANFIEDEENDQWLKNNLNVLDWGLYFMAEYGCTEEVGFFVRDAFNLKRADEEIKLDRVEELYLFIQNSPNGLLATCPDYDLQTYSDLLNLEVPNTIINQLASYGECRFANSGVVYYRPCFSLQPIELGTSALVNMDYYAVEITQIPDFDSSGGPDTKEELYEVFREHFTNVPSGMTTITEPNCPSPISTIDASWAFEPYEWGVDPSRWGSKTIGARFFIDAAANQLLAKPIVDDGAVITIQENELTFIVATILTPRSSTQPFSGKRMWGIRTNENGNCEIFTRGIDRAKPVAMVDLIGEIFDGCDDLDYFEIADRTWKNFQTKVFDFIIRNNGVGVIKESRADHIDYKKVYQKLKSNVPVSFVSCQ
jgi:hypothetical protein